MKNVRIIPLLNIKGKNVVKPVHTEALKVVGEPQDFFRKYQDKGADELVYLDIVASLYQRNLDFDLLKKVTDGIFIPVTAGGGIRSVQDINNALRAGADKIAINTYATKHPEFLNQAVREFGSQCIVLFVEAKKKSNGKYEVYTDGGREPSGLDVLEWVKRALELGVGEVLICSVDKDGTKKGYDLDLIKLISPICPVPLIVHGGAGTPQSCLEAVIVGADAVVASSIFHYGEYTMDEVKKCLADNQIRVRKLS